jgi:signal transduction histidine kinase
VAEVLLTPAAASTPDELLEASWPGRRRAIRGRELRLELGMTAAFLVAAGALLAVAAPVPAPLPVTAALVIAYAVAARTSFPIGAGLFTPTQLFLVPLFAVAPAALVPPLVFAAYVLAALAATVTRQAHLDRLVFCGGDAFHALGPALVLTAFAGGDGAAAAAWVIAAAFGAQLLADFASSSLHELLATGATARVHVRLLLQIWGADVALGAVGLLAAWAATIEPWAALAPVPLLLLMRTIAADRVRKIGAAHERLVALEQERGRRQAAAQLLERHTQFLQDVSHELRTPVTIARGHLELLRRSCGPTAESEIAIDELQRIERIIDRLLILARAQHPGAAARRRLEAEVFVEDRFVRWSDAVPRAWRLGDLVAGAIEADPDALCAALDALIENAIRHTDPAQSITVRSRAEGATLVIEVSDGGSGIAPGAMQEIFKRFARADVVHQRPDGTGLGLAIVDAVAKAHGGACTVESSPAGSTFALRLPNFEPAPVAAR